MAYVRVRISFRYLHTYVHSHSAHNSQCINGWTTYKKYGQTAILFSISFTLTLIPFSIFPFDFVNRDAHKNASHPAKLRKQPFNWLWQFAQHPRCNFMSLHALYPIHNQNVIDLVLCIFFFGTVNSLVLHFFRYGLFVSNRGICCFLLILIGAFACHPKYK